MCTTRHFSCDSTSNEGLAAACKAQELVRTLASMHGLAHSCAMPMQNLSLRASSSSIRFVRSRGDLRKHNQMYSRMVDAISINKAHMGRSLSVVVEYPCNRESLIEDHFVTMIS